MGERRSVEAMKARAEKLDVVVREREVAAAEQRLIYAKKYACEQNERALAIAQEAAKQCKIATKLAAHHLYEDIDEHAAELLASAKYRAPLPARTRPDHLGAVCLTVRAPTPARATQ